MCVHLPHMCWRIQNQKMALDPLEIELEAAVGQTTQESVQRYCN